MIFLKIDCERKSFDVGQYCLFPQNVTNGTQDFNEVTKFSLQELQVLVEELPSGVDPSAREVSVTVKPCIFLCVPEFKHQ